MNNFRHSFSKYGRVENIKIIRDLFSQTSKGLGFVEMSGKTEAGEALNALNTYGPNGKKLVVNEARLGRSQGRRK